MRDAICAHEKMETVFVANHYTCYTKWELALRAISPGLNSSLWKMVFTSGSFDESRAYRS